MTGAHRKLLPFSLLAFSSLIFTEFSPIVRGEEMLGRRDDNLHRFVRDATLLAPCGTWTPWVNDNHPAPPSVRTDKEIMTTTDLKTFCPDTVGGHSTTLHMECKSTGDVAFHGYKTFYDSIVHCIDITEGADCKPIAERGSSAVCPDVSLRYRCDCRPPSTTTPISTTSPSLLSSSTSAQAKETVTAGSLLSSSAIVKAKETVTVGNVTISIWLLVLIAAVILALCNCVLTICLYKRVKNFKESKKASKTTKSIKAGQKVYPLDHI